jgi:hypothetical protein
MLREREFEEPRPAEQRAVTDMKTRTLTTLLYTLFFGTVTGLILTVALSAFIPQFYTEWAGSLVCAGRVQYVMFKQTYICYTSANNFFDLGDAMYWAVFKRLIFLTVPVGFLLIFGLMKIGVFLYQRRAAAGF